MINSVTNTSILNKSYVNRGLIVHQSTTHNVIRGTDGTLWAGVRERHLRGQINLYKSSTGGFSWNNVFKGSFPTGVNWGNEETISTLERGNGPFISLNLFENLDKVILWHAFRKGGVVSCWPFVFNTSTGARMEDEVPPTAPDYAINADELCVKCPYNENMIYMCYIQNGRFTVRTFYPNLITLYRTLTPTTTSNYVSTFDAYARKDGLVDIACANTSEQVRYFRYDDKNQSYTPATTVGSASGRVADLGIARDGNGALLVTYSDIGLSSAQIRYAISYDNGVNWNGGTISTSGVYYDAVTGDPAGRVSCVAGLNGFLITYTESLNGRPRTCVRRLTGSNLEAAQEIATKSHPGESVVGAHFFETPVGKLQDISDPGLVRVAFQVGQGNAHNGLDTVPVKFGQELLSDSAYPQRTQDTAPPPDVPTVNQSLVRVNILAGPENNEDFYAIGAVGRITKKYIKTFKEVGTPVVLLKYNPTPHAETNDRSAYNAPEELTSFAVLTPMSYDFPFPQSNEGFTDFVERDARRIHLPPDFHLEREFVLNDGNYLKRTIWTVLFGGNEYEISQVVPSLINGDITHYSANMFVVGPSNDPFSRVVLPSET